MKIIEIIKDTLFHIFIPNICFWKGKDIDLNVFIIPKRYSGELAFMIDLLFYGYMITALTSWFNPIIYEHARFYFLMVLAFFTGSSIIPFFIYTIKSDKNKKDI